MSPQRSRDGTGARRRAIPQRAKSKQRLALRLAERLAVAEGSGGFAGCSGALCHPKDFLQPLESVFHGAMKFRMAHKEDYTVTDSNAGIYS